MTAARGATLGLLLAISLAGTAQGHGGADVISGRNAAYSMSMQIADVRDARGRQMADITLYPIRRGNGAPENSAEVAVRIDGRAPLPAALQGDGYELLVPTDTPGAWRTWRISATVDGAAGALTITSEGLPPATTEEPPWTLLTGVLALAAAVGLLVRIRRTTP